MNACVDGMQKTKKNLNFCLFAEGNDQGPLQRRVLCRGLSHCPRQRFFLKKIKFLQHFFAEGHGWGPSAKTLKKIICRGPARKPSAKIFQKKKNNSLPRAVPLPSSKIFWKNSTHFFAEGHAWRPSAKIFQKKIFAEGPRDGCFSLPSAAPALGKGFAECPIKGPRQRPSSSTQNSPRALCRGLPSAKPLPRVNGPLSRA